MYPWLKIPLIRAFIPFLAGILLYRYIPDCPNLVLVGAATVPFFYLLISRFYLSKMLNYARFRWVDGVCLTVLFLFGGYIISHAKDQQNSKNHYRHHISKESVLVLKITEQPEEKAKTIKLQAKLTGIVNKYEYIPATGNVLAYVKKDSLSLTLAYSNLIAVKNCFYQIPSPLNPGQFDYRKNLANKSVYHQAFVKPDQWLLINHGRENPVMSLMFRIKNSIIKSIKVNITDDSQQAMLLALLIGYTSELNDEIRQSFTETGIMHLLAVSGMHVGLIYMVLNFLFKGLHRLRNGNIIFIITVTVMLWMYAGITGFSPSVLRATIMFNFLLIGKNIRKVNFVYNSILVSAFLLLLYDPFLIFHVGFQLSYAAVIGIVFVQPYLNSLLTSKSWVLQKLWPLISVTISAQFFTLPLILYYFNQFPVYFFLANLLIIPISTLVIYFGFLMVFFDAINIQLLTHVFALIEEFTMEVMTRIIFYIRQLPYVMIDNIYLSPLMTVVLFFVIIFFCFWLFYRSRRHLFLFLTSLILFVVTSTIWNYVCLKREKLVIYAIPGNTLISLQENRQGLYIGDSAIVYNKKQLRLNTGRHMIASGIGFTKTSRYLIGDEIRFQGLYADKNIISANSFRILLMNQSNPYFNLPEKINADIILFSHNPNVSIENLTGNFNFKQLVFDCSNTTWMVKKWKQECLKHSVEFVDINETGALIIDI
jgi:competence protein ComEC